MKNDERNSAICAAYASGEKNLTIGMRFGISEHEVSRIAHYFGLYKGGGKNLKEQPARVAGIIAAYAGGLPLRQIQETYDVSRDTIRKLTMRAGVPRRPNGRPFKQRAENAHSNADEAQIPAAS